MAKPIVVGYDPRHADHAPIDFGVAVARVTHAPLILAIVQARAPFIPISVGQSQPYAIVDDDLVHDAAAAARDLEEEVRALGVDRVDVVRREGTSAAHALHATAEQQDAGLLVVGSARRSDAGRVRAGSTAGRLLHGAPCPIAVVPASWANGAPQTIGVGFVDSEEGREALRGAHALARRVHATLRVITVVKPAFTDYAEAEPTKPARDRRDPEDVEGEHKLMAERALRDAVAQLGGDVPVEIEAVIGEPADVLVSVSEHLDLLVCGSRGYGPLRAVLLGSVTGLVMAAAHCPVVVVPRGVNASLEALVGEAPGAAAHA